MRHGLACAGSGCSVSGYCADAVTEMCKGEEIRTRVGRFPYVLLRVVALRIERALREEALHEWRIELGFHP